MNFIKSFFKNNDERTVQNDSDGFLEKDAAPADKRDAFLRIRRGSCNLSSNRSEPQDAVVLNDVSPTLSERIAASRVTNDATNSGENSINVHNVNQQLVMQISDINSLHFGSVYNIRNNKPISMTGRTESCHNLEDEKIRTKFSKRTTTIDLMMNSLEEPNYRLLDTIATHLGSGWKQVMRELGYSEGQISTSELDNHIHGTKEIIYQLLVDWMNTAEDELRTVGYLTKLLWNCGHRECVHKMKIIWKLELKNKMV